MSSVDGNAILDDNEPERDNPVVRCLRTRTRLMPANDYHPTHSKEALAKLPEIRDFRSAAYDLKDREDVIIASSKYQLTDEDANILKKEVTHLSFETTLKIFAHYHYNLPITIAAAREMVAPQLLPDKVQDMFVANIAIEREQHPTKKKSYKGFYMADFFRKVANSKTLADFYYSEKNKNGGNWRLEHEDLKPAGPEDMKEMEEKMRASGIKIIRDETLGGNRKNKRHRKSRKGSNLRRSDSEVHEERDEEDADSTSSSPGTSGDPMNQTTKN